MADLHPQLVLRLRGRPQPSFGNFVATGNEEVVAAVRALAPGDALWLWGAPGVGRSHLLLAAARCAGRYASLAAGARPALLDGLEEASLVAIDDLDAALPDRALEVALFRLVNELRARRGRLLIAASAPPRRVETELGTRLPGALIGWILRRFPRDPAALTAVVDTLDEAAARARRPPSVALARSVFG